LVPSRTTLKCWQYLPTPMYHISAYHPETPQYQTSSMQNCVDPTTPITSNKKLLRPP